MPPSARLRSAPLFGLVAFSVIGALGVLVGLGGVAGLRPWLVALPSLGVAVYGWWRRRELPRFCVVGLSRRGDGMAWDLFVPFAATLAVVALASVGTFFDGAAPGSTDRTVVNAAFALALLSPLGFLALVLRADLEAVRALSRVLRAPTVGRVGGVGARTGILTHGALEKRRAHVTTTTSREWLVTREDRRVERRDHGSVSSAWEEQVHAPASLSLALDGADVRLEPAGVSFASVKAGLEAGSGEVVGGHTSAQTAAVSTTDAVRVEFAEPGDGVLVVGRFEAGPPPTVRGVDGAPVLLFAVPARRSPVGELRRLLFLWVGSLVALALLGSGGAWLMLRRLGS